MLNQEGFPEDGTSTSMKQMGQGKVDFLLMMAWLMKNWMCSAQNVCSWSHGRDVGDENTSWQMEQVISSIFFSSFLSLSSSMDEWMNG